MAASLALADAGVPLLDLVSAAAGDGARVAQMAKSSGGVATFVSDSGGPDTSHILGAAALAHDGLMRAAFTTV